MELIKQRDAVNTSYNELKEASKRPIGLPGTSTGFFDWDLTIGGWRPRKINTLALRSGAGKTSTLVQISKAAGQVVDNRRSELLIASWEQAPSELVTRYVSWETGYTLDMLNHPYLFDPQQKKRIDDAYQKAAKFPVHYHPSSTNIDVMLKVINDFILNCRTKEQIEGVKIQPVFVLDYIGMAKGRTKYANKTYDLADFLQELKADSNRTGLSSLVLAQINRNADSKEVPEISDISDSSSIENNSDVIILGNRPEQRRKETVKDPETGTEIPSNGKILWMFEKNRGGRTPSILGECSIAHNRFWHRHHKWDSDITEFYKDQSFWERHFRQ